jgi:TolB protein
MSFSKTLLFALGAALLLTSARPALAQLPLASEPIDIFSIHVVVGPSERDLDAVALYLPQCRKADKPAVCDRLTRVLRKDLEITGLFKLLDEASFVVDGATESFDKTHYEGWFDTGARFVLKGRILDGQVQLKLHNVVEKGSFRFKHETFAAEKGAVLKGVHAFMNELVLAMTGKPGLFDTRIWYVSRDAVGAKSIRSIFMDGFGGHTLVDNGSINLFPSPAPKGEVLYTSFLSGLPQIHIGDKRVTHDDMQYRGAQFSPDKKRLAVSVNVSGQSDIFLMDPPTGALGKNLTDDPGDDVSPNWSPDGRMIAFVSNRSGNPHLYVMKADGTATRRITFAGYYNSTPDWGGNGLIVFTGLDEGQSDIFTVDLGGNIRRLTQGQGLNKDPRWSKGGRYVVFASKRGDKFNLYIMTPDGRYQWPILPKRGEYSTPWW